MAIVKRASSPPFAAGVMATLNASSGGRNSGSSAPEKPLARDFSRASTSGLCRVIGSAVVVVVVVAVAGGALAATAGVTATGSVAAAMATTLTWGG